MSRHGRAIAEAAQTGGGARKRGPGLPSQWAVLGVLIIWLIGNAVVRGASPAFSPLGAWSVPAASPLPLHVSGNTLVDSAGHVVILRGVNRSGTEYSCVNSPALEDGPDDRASVAAMRAWQVNAVRIPLNEDCWLGINQVVLGGASYQAGIERYARLLLAAGIYPILDLHISAPATVKALSQQPMPDADHAPTFWEQVADVFGHNQAVIFDLFNEPFPDHNGDSAAAWRCWRDGCTETTGDGLHYQAVGMRALVSAVRSRGAMNVLMLGGIQFANTIDEWPRYRPPDPANNLVAAQHFYNNSACASPSCRQTTTAIVARQAPIVAGEVGDTDCTISNTAQILQFFERNHLSYVAWTWGTNFGCESLIRNYDGTPTQPYGQWFHDWVLRAVGGTVAAQPLATFMDNVGVVEDGRQLSCGLDDQNFCYSSQALAKSGLRPGGTIPYNDARFRWAPSPGTQDNVIADGQTVAISPTVAGATSLNVLGAATHGPAAGEVTLKYTDGVTSTATLDFSDWTLRGATGPVRPVHGNAILVRAAYRDKSDGTQDRQATFLFGVSLPLDRRRALASVRLPLLPQSAYAPHMHIFALSLSH